MTVLSGTCTGCGIVVYPGDEHKCPKVSELERAIEHVEAWIDSLFCDELRRVHLDPALVRLVTDAARSAL